MMAQLKIMLVPLVAVLSLVGCGGAQLGDRVDVSLTQTDARVEFELSDGLELSLAGEFPIYDGIAAIEFVPATRETNSKVVIKADLMALAEQELGVVPIVTLMPNGAPMPVSMMPPLYAIRVLDEGDVKVDGLFNLLGELQLGAFVHIAQFQTEYFPPGVNICQNFRNGEGIAFAAICIFGPGVDGSPGGVFLGANFGDVLGNVLPGGSSESVASNSLRSLSRSSIVTPPVGVAEPVVYRSVEWDEERHDPYQDLNGRKGYKAMRNARKILSR